VLRYPTQRAMRLRVGWGTHFCGWLRVVVLGVVVSHPTRDEAARWMGPHFRGWLRGGVLGVVVPHPARVRLGCGLFLIELN
jgi:hypothetical protein